MPTTSTASSRSITSGGHRTASLQRNAPCPTARMAAPACLMGSGSHLLIPNLDRVPLEHHFHAGERAAIRLAQALLELDIADPSHWRRARRDPTDYMQATLNRWIDLHGGKAIRRRFCLRLTLSEVVDEYLEAGEPDPDGQRLYLFLHPDSAAFVVAGPTLELLGRQHPRLPATFYRLLTGAVNRWARTYDHVDAEDHVAMLREWAEGEEEQYEIADVAASVPACIKEKPLGLRTLRRMATQAREEGVKALLGAALELERTSALAPRPEVTDEMREQLMDTNPPLPAVLVVFAENDLVEAEFENESQTWGEASSEPNLILPLSAFDLASIRSAFHTLAVVCRTLAAASRLIDLMPGNERWITDSEVGDAIPSGNRS
jgi:hypothetical protein